MRLLGGTELDIVRCGTLSGGRSRVQEVRLKREQIPGIIARTSQSPSALHEGGEELACKPDGETKCLERIIPHNLCLPACNPFSSSGHAHEPLGRE